MSRKMLRTLAVLSLVLLTATGAHAAGRSFSGLEVSDFPKVWERFADWLDALTGRPQREAVTKAGSSMDPNGNHPASLSVDEGSQMDPNGR